MDISGFPYLTHVNIIHATVANAGAMVVVVNTDPSCSMEVQAAPLKPYHPNQRMNTPKTPSGRLCPGIALILPSFLYFPLLGPRIDAPIIAHTPPTICTAHDPAKS